MQRLAMAVVFATAIIGVMSPAEAALITYSSAVAFDTANPGLPVEGFENADVDTTTEFEGPLNSATDNGVFSPGDILPGITFIDNPPSDPFFFAGLYLAAPGQSSNPTLAIGSSGPDTDTLDILLDPGVMAIGFEIFQNFGFTPDRPDDNQSGEPQSYTVSVYGLGDGLLGTFIALVPSGAAGFFGVSSDIDTISRINIMGPRFGDVEAFEVIDNVRFGGTVPTPIPEPTSILLLGSGLAVAIRRLRNSQAGQPVT